ncbi:MAG: hypothetical protein ACRDNP_00865 [Gaiellaceae bacterium]
MKRKKRKISSSPEERAARQARYEALMARLEWHYQRITAELEAKGRPIEGPPMPDFPHWRSPQSQP